MSHTDSKTEWERYRADEYRRGAAALARLGFSLEDTQPLIGGEKYLMQALTTKSGKKLVLLGSRDSDGKRVVIKVSSDPAGKEELAHEHTCKNALRRLPFAYQAFLCPEDVLYTTMQGLLVSIQEYIPQERPFLAYPFRDQFFLALNAFKTQEGAHATTSRHRRFILKTFGARDAREYLHRFTTFAKAVRDIPQPPSHLSDLMQNGERLLTDTAHQQVLELYGSFLTHTDFVPHNFRLADHTLYLLDQSAIRFGNKYEGWARFINFMTLYNPPLACALTDYVQLNRAPEESLSLKLMRIYRLGELICYYTQTLPRSTEALHTLNRARIAFWTEVLDATLHDTTVPTHVIQSYTQTRDTLRDSAEQERQKYLF